MTRTWINEFDTLASAFPSPGQPISRSAPCRAAKEDDEAGAAGETATATVEQHKVSRLPPWRVILHNDEVNVMEHVVLTIMKLTPLKLEEAARKTLEAHERGLALLLVTHRERAELYVEQFQTFKITVTCEPEA